MFSACWNLSIVLFFVLVVSNIQPSVWTITVFVETLNKCFREVCELDIVFNFYKVASFPSNTKVLSNISFWLLVVSAVSSLIHAIITNLLITVWFVLQVHTILDEIILGGQVLETSSEEVASAVDAISRSLYLCVCVCARARSSIVVNGSLGAIGISCCNVVLGS